MTLRHAIAGVLAAALALGACSARAADVAQPQLPLAPGSGAAGLEPRLGQQVPLATRFRASDGRDVALGDVLGNGKPALLVLAYNRCTMLCSLVLRSVSRLVKDFELRPGEQFSLVTISIDPSDTVFEASRMQAALLDAAGMAGQTHAWEFLVGERPDIDAVADAVGFRYAWDPGTEQYAHPAVVFAISSSGKVAGFFDGLNPDPSAIRAALESRRPVAAAATIEDVILNCFRFDAAQTRYGKLITWALRGGAAAVAIALTALLWRLARGARPAGEPR
jgi:protein SCO1